jgi:hypothetical protein
MLKATLTLALGVSLCLLGAPAANAMGFGQTVTATTLGQALNFSARVLLDPDETLARECVAAEVFVGEARLSPANVRVTLEPVGEGNDRNVRVTSSTVIDEPVITVNVTVGCNSRLSRRFVSFIDPPPVNLASADSSSLPPQRSDNQIAPLMDIARAADASRRRAVTQGSAASPAGEGDRRSARRSPAGQRMASAAGTTPQAGNTRPRNTRKSHTAATRRGSATTLASRSNRNAPRLQLEAPALRAAASAPPAATVVVAAAPLVMPDAPAAQVGASPAPGEAASQAQALAHASEQIQALEAGLARLRIDTQAQQQTLVALQARLRQAESERYANVLVYVLAAGLVFFALLAAALWALRPRQRRRARWFDANPRGRAARGVGQPPTASAPPSAATHVDTQPPLIRRDRPTAASPLTTQASSIGGLDVTTVLGPEPMRPVATRPDTTASPAASAAKKSHALSMEELIDLEQQAEFFVVLGQDEAAIDLLSAHMRGAGGVSPLPYLKLLEIHQRRGDQPAYERVREAFKERFHALAPEWNSDLDAGRSLEDYPQAVARLQSLWSTPLHAMQALEASVFRRVESDETFDFPAYLELLFLYSIARELAGHVETDSGSIDLFLPLEDTVPDWRSHQASPRQENSDFSVDLDVSTWPPDAQVDDLVVIRSAGRRGKS